MSDCNLKQGLGGKGGDGIGGGGSGGCSPCIAVAMDAAATAAATAAAGGTATSGGGGSGGVDTAPGVDIGGAESVIPESVVAPLIGAGANVYILTNELTQSMRQKLGTSWPVLQDTLNSRCARLLAGGVLASLACLLAWRLLRRLAAAKPKPPPVPTAEGGQWVTTKTFELTPVADTADGEGGGDLFPVRALPKIQLRIADSPQHTARGPDLPPVYCKTGDPATRNRHTRHRQQENPALCECPSHSCESSAAEPRLLYSVRQNQLVQQATSTSDQNLLNLLTYASSPLDLCSALVASPGCGGVCRCGGCTSCPGGLPQCAASRQYALMQELVRSGSTPGTCTLPTEGISLPCDQQSRPVSLLADTSQHQTQTQALDSDGGSWASTTANTRAGSVCQQTQGNPVDEEDVDRPGHYSHKDAQLGAAAWSSAPTTSSTTPSQSVPTRAAPSPVTPSLCTNAAPFRSDHVHFHHHPAAVLAQPMVYQTPHGALLQLSHAEARSSLPYQPLHHHAVHRHAPQSPALTVCSNRSQLVSPLPQPIAYPLAATDPSQALSAQQRRLRVQQRQQQLQEQQVPVVQHPSESSVSQNSSEVCSSQENRQGEGGGGADGGYRTGPPDVVPQEGQHEQLQPLQTSPCLHVSLPARSVATDNCFFSRPRALMDHGHGDYSWVERGHGGLHTYRPTGPYMPAAGFMPPNAGFFPGDQPPWSSPVNMTFLPPYVHGAPPGVLSSSPLGMFPTSVPVHLMAGNVQSPFFYSHAHFPGSSKPAPFHNFNLSNSNTQATACQPSSSTASTMPPSVPESCRVRLIDSDFSVSTGTDHMGAEVADSCPGNAPAPTGGEDTFDETTLLTDYAPAPIHTLEHTPEDLSHDAEQAEDAELASVALTEAQDLPEAVNETMLASEPHVVLLDTADLQVEDDAVKNETSTSRDGLETQL